MSFIRADRVCETTTTTGAGAYTLAGAIVGYQPFSGVCAIGDSFDYFVEAVASNGSLTGAWETGTGTYAAGNTFTRTMITSSSNAGLPVTWLAGTKRVALSVTADALNAMTALEINLATRLIQTQGIVASIVLRGNLK